MNLKPLNVSDSTSPIAVMKKQTFVSTDIAAFAKTFKKHVFQIKLQFLFYLKAL